MAAPKAKKAKPSTGWWNPTPYSTRRRVVFHYIAKDGRSLCGKWGYPITAS